MAARNPTGGGRGVDGFPPASLRAGAIVLLAVTAVVCSWTSGRGEGGRIGSEPAAHWVQLPRARDGVGEPADLPFAPAPNERALGRRVARGRPDRVAELSRGPRPDALAALVGSGARVRYVSRWLSAASVEAGPAQLERLRRRFGEQAIRPVRVLRGRASLPAAEGPPRARRAAPVDGALDYGPSGEVLAQIQVERLHALGLTGRGVRALVLDTGFLLSHSALDSVAVVATRDFVFNDDEVANEPVDGPSQHDHGTGVLALLAGRAEGQLVGAAFGCEVLLAKTERVGSETRLEEDHFVAALEWGEALGADLATASLGYLGFPDEPDSFAYAPGDLDGDTAVTTRAFDDLVALGVVALSAAGNFGPDPSSLITPADSDSALAIGSVRADSLVSVFSSRGPTADGRIKPDLCARGTRVPWATTPDGYGTASGTSVATPLVAGVVALALEAHPAWGPGEVAAALRTTATQAFAPDDDQGWGIVRAWDAVMEVEEPVVPLPFALVTPGDGLSRSTAPLEFRWRSAQDLQSPGALRYQLAIRSSGGMGDSLVTVAAGPDTSAVVSRLSEGEWTWRVLAIDPEGHVRTAGPRTLHLSAPVAGPVAPPLVGGWLAAGRPFPNPFNPRMVLRLEVERPAWVRVEVLDLAGRRVRTLEAGAHRPPGSWNVVWEGVDGDGRPVASGVYLLRVSARDQGGGHSVVVRRGVLLR